MPPAEAPIVMMSLRAMTHLVDRLDAIFGFGDVG